jgi:hypothetical protein
VGNTATAFWEERKLQLYKKKANSKHQSPAVEVISSPILDVIPTFLETVDSVFYSQYFATYNIKFLGNGALDTSLKHSWTFSIVHLLYFTHTHVSKATYTYYT